MLEAADQLVKGGVIRIDQRWSEEFRGSRTDLLIDQP